jgi:hypothetical protein
MKVFIVENLSVTNHLDLDMQMKVGKNVRHSRCSHFPCTTHDCIPPRHRQIVFIAEWADKHGGSSHLDYSYSYRHDKRVTDSRPPIDISQHDIHSPRAF